MAGLDVTISISQTKTENLLDALQWQANRSAPVGPPVVVDLAYATDWIQKAGKARINEMVAEYMNAPEQADLSTLTRAQRNQVLALIASFR